MSETHHSVTDAKKDAQEKAIMKEMMPYFFYALIPLVITIAIAMTFAPNMTLP